MSFFSRLFGNSDPLDSLRRARNRGAWADLLARGEEIDPEKLDPAGKQELASLLSNAGDALAQINLEEMEACLRAGDTARAAEHLSLATEKARSDAMRQRVAGCSLPTGGVSTVIPAVATPAAAGCAGSCSSGHAASAQEIEDDLDDDTRLELILSSYPPAWRERYLGMGGLLRSAFFLSHEGEEKGALKSFDSVPDAERDDLFFFERGALLARMGDGNRALEDLQKAIVLNPDHLLAHKALIDLELAAGKTASAESRLRALLSNPEGEVFCHGRLCAIEANRNNPGRAIEHGLLAAPGGDPQVLLMTASLLEKAGRLGEAEALLSRLPGGGCSGANLALAEFWVRHSLHPDKALSAFKGALRHDPGNSRWLLRIAQIYNARGWRKDAVPLLENVVSDAGLDAGLAQEAHDLLIICRSNGNA